ncbi:hypothetical protein N9B76_00890 [Candidatus Thioglobus sp.]|nr:hypothetical protein [Candidatus Thioglobus sp.]
MKKEYLKAFSEVEENNIQNKELWANAFAQCDGDKEKQKSIYVKLRARELNRGMGFNPFLFELNQFMWFIIFMIAVGLLAIPYNFQVALGIVAAQVIKNGIFFTPIPWVFMITIKHKRKLPWRWYDWLNMITYATLISSLVYYIFLDQRLW